MPSTGLEAGHVAQDTDRAFLLVAQAASPPRFAFAQFSVSVWRISGCPRSPRSAGHWATTFEYCRSTFRGSLTNLMSGVIGHGVQASSSLASIEPWAGHVNLVF